MNKMALNTPGNSGDQSARSADHEFLSLFLEDARQGVDVSRRYPGFYQKLIIDPELRQAFLDILHLMDENINQALASIPSPARANLEFLLIDKTPISRSMEKGWKFHWMRTRQELQALFSPPQLAYRNNTNFLSDEEFLIFQNNFRIDDFQYSISIVCALGEDLEAGLLARMNVGITPEGSSSQPPLKAILEWGHYTESVIIAGEGRIALPPIALAKILDSDLENIISDLELTIEII
jgi:hypothetical protein